MGVGGTRIVSFRQPNYYPVTQQKGASQTGAVAQPYSSYCGLLMRWAVVEIRRRGKGKGKGRKRKREREREKGHTKFRIRRRSYLYFIRSCLVRPYSSGNKKNSCSFHKMLAIEIVLCLKAR
ncbi:EC1118_1L7_1035p [Saccharomyces cerevisiae EC1118]|uniref:EC1118_1L7_1035p n=1 Tax=Saccharomyces cerevisiae (strain Lalvin EC1118 / Prise de mousse) TaxID=643680 RepID=C8ZDL8_YEAS8|nr:EC1118_1L7_1035p [Saccharomyces cerevisiae EC1118]